LLDLRRFQRELNAGRLRRKCLVISNLPEERAIAASQDDPHRNWPAVHGQSIELGGGFEAERFNHEWRVD
jgi:hypothetical protein